MEEDKPKYFILRVTANREEQVLGFMYSNAIKKGHEIYSIVHPPGMKGYIIVEAKDRESAEAAASGVPYARGLLNEEVSYEEIEHLVEVSKKTTTNIKKNDIVEIISGPFKREQAKVIRLDNTKSEVVIELLNAAVPIPITLNIEDIKVIRRENQKVEEEQ
ncbi:MAG: transcription termination/antitermination protein NusG [Candidatus Woesearchaeota archaeon]|nr:transcription termination/antitermination protein NusG [Candidatus Woesearchaeota archaeon]